MRHWIWCDIDQRIPILTSASPRSILVLSGRYHIISNASLVNNCISILTINYRKFQVKFLSVSFLLFSYPSICGLGAQKYRLIKAVLLSIHNICVGWELRKHCFDYTLLSKGMKSNYISMYYSIHSCRRGKESFCTYVVLPQTFLKNWPHKQREPKKFKTAGLIAFSLFMNNNCNKSNDPLHRLKRNYAFCQNQRPEGPDYEIKSALYQCTGKCFSNLLGVTRPRSAVDSESDCRSRGREFDPGPVPYFRGDGYEVISTLPLIQEGLLSVTSESICAKYIKNV